MSSTETIVRQATIADRSAIWRFIELTYGAKAPFKTGPQWNWLYLDNPWRDKDTGRVSIWIAVKGDDIVGHTCSFPFELKVGDEIYRAGSGYDLMVLPSCRGERLGSRLSQAVIDHYDVYLGMWMVPTTRNIYKRAGAINTELLRVYRKLIRLDAGTVYRYLVLRFKDRPWLSRLLTIGCRVFMLHRIFASGVNLVFDVRRLFRPGKKHGSRTQIREIERFGEEIDRLWSATSDGLGVIVKRDQRFLNWRFTDNPQLHYRSFIATRNGVVRGYSVLRKNDPSELSVGFISDLYASPEDTETLEDLVSHAICFLEKDVAAIRCATTVAEFRRVLLKLGFQERMQTDPVYFCSDPTVRSKLAAFQGRWFLTFAEADGDQLAPL